MKALHTPVNIVVAAVVIIIAALVILTVFGVGITPVRTLTDARSHCSIQGVSTCQATGNPPPGWNSPSVMVDGVLISCGDATGYPSCPYILGTGEGSIDYFPGESFHAGDSEGRDIGVNLHKASIDVGLGNLQKGGV